MTFLLRRRTFCWKGVSCYWKKNIFLKKKDPKKDIYNQAHMCWPFVMSPAITLFIVGLDVMRCRLWQAISHFTTSRTSTRMVGVGLKRLPLPAFLSRTAGSIFAPIACRRSGSGTATGIFTWRRHRCEALQDTGAILRYSFLFCTLWWHLLLMEKVMPPKATKQKIYIAKWHVRPTTPRAAAFAAWKCASQFPAASAWCESWPSSAGGLNKRDAKTTDGRFHDDPLIVDLLEAGV